MHYDRNADDFQPWEKFLDSLSARDSDDMLGLFGTTRKTRRQQTQAEEFQQHFFNIRYFPTDCERLAFAEEALFQISPAEKRGNPLFDTILRHILLLRDAQKRENQSADIDFIAECNVIILEHCPEDMSAYEESLYSNLDIYEQITDEELRRATAEKALSDATLQYTHNLDPVMADWCRIIEEEYPDEVLDAITSLLYCTEDLNPSYIDQIESIAFKNFWAVREPAYRAPVTDALSMMLPDDHFRHNFWTSYQEYFILNELFCQHPDDRETCLEELTEMPAEPAPIVQTCRGHLSNIAAFAAAKKTELWYASDLNDALYPDSVPDTLIRSFLLYGHKTYAETLLKMYFETREGMNDKEKCDTDALYTLIYKDTLEALSCPQDEPVTPNSQEALTAQERNKMRNRLMIEAVQRAHRLPPRTETPEQKIARLLEIHENVFMSAPKGSHLETFAQNAYILVKDLCEPVLHRRDRHDPGFSPNDVYRYRYGYDVN